MNVTKEVSGRGLIVFDEHFLTFLDLFLLEDLVHSLINISHCN